MHALNPIAVLAIFLSAALIVAGWRISRSSERPPFGFGKDETLPLRGLLALLVVLGHLDNKTGHVYPLIAQIHWATPAVAVFFFLSGYGLLKSREGAVAAGTLSGYWGRLFRRAAFRLLPALIILGILNLAVIFLFGKIDLHELLVRLASGRFLTIPHHWYVLALVFLYLAFGISFSLRRRICQFGMLFGLVCAYWIFCRFVFHWPFWWWTTVFSFFVGVLFSFHEERVRHLIAVRPLTVYVAMAVILTVAFGLYGIRSLPIAGRLKEPFCALLGPSVALLLYSSDFLTRVRPLKVLGVMSYEIYLAHGIFEVNLLELNLPAFTYIAAVIAATLAVAMPLCRLDEAIRRSGTSF